MDFFLIFVKNFSEMLTIVLNLSYYGIKFAAISIKAPKRLRYIQH